MSKEGFFAAFCILVYGHVQTAASIPVNAIISFPMCLTAICQHTHTHTQDVYSILVLILYSMSDVLAPPCEMRPGVNTLRTEFLLVGLLALLCSTEPQGAAALRPGLSVSQEQVRALLGLVLQSVREALSSQTPIACS